MIFILFYFGREVVIKIFFKVVLVYYKKFVDGLRVCLYGLKFDLNNIELKILKWNFEFGLNNKCFI